MYITYCRNQKSLNLVDTTQYRLNATAEEYRPSFLVRVSDWKKVPGQEAKNGYCALSYVWAQSGDVKQQEDGEYTCTDNGEHCIVESYDMDEGDSVTMIPIVEGSQTQYKVQFIPSAKSKATVRHVTYNEFLQQLCKDFQIEYLWYDKICIDQTDKENRLREIKQMYRIYGSACYTMAIVPEVHILDPKHLEIIDPMYQDTKAITKAWFTMGQTSLWWKRSWTLEETMTSKRILVIGTDTHFWQHSFHTCDIPTTYDHFSSWMLDFANQPVGGSVNQALRQAHFRTSSKEHDKIFSLANIFPEIFKKMEIDYKINVMTAFQYFYRTMVTKDLSILCFGSNLRVKGTILRLSTMMNHHLPSWTGVSGTHLPIHINTTSTWLQLPPSVCDEMLLYISTQKYKKLTIVPYDHGCFSPLSNNDKERWYQQIATFKKREDSKGPYNNTVSESTALMDWAIKMKNVSYCQATHYYHSEDAASTTMQIRPLSLTEDCNDCIILPILFQINTPIYTTVDIEGSTLRTISGYTHDFSLPVLKRCMNDINNPTEERYKAIGLFYLGSPYHRDLNSKDPDEILYSIFKDDTVHNEVKEFIIE